MAVSLTVLTVSAAAILGIVKVVSEPQAEVARNDRQRQALVEVLPPFNAIDSGTTTEEGLTIYRATDESGNAVGTAVRSFSDAGFSGHISLLFGFDAEGVLHGYTVLEHNETPGLGAKMDIWFKAEGTTHDVVGSSAELQVSKDGGDIDAITGATITSRAFLEALNKARKAL